MSNRYFNHTTQIAESRWEERSFAHYWWQIGQQDSQWVPPYAPAWRWAMDDRKNPHLARLNHAFLYQDGLPKRRQPQRADMAFTRQALYEIPLTAVTLLYNKGLASSYWHRYNRCITKGWEQLIIGPLWQDLPPLLQQAKAQQTYHLYESNL